MSNLSYQYPIPGTVRETESDSLWDHVAAFENRNRERERNSDASPVLNLQSLFAIVY
jgi:hypothetical protein